MGDINRFAVEPNPDGGFYVGGRGGWTVSAHPLPPVLVGDEGAGRFTVHWLRWNPETHQPGFHRAFPAGAWYETATIIDTSAAGVLLFLQLNGAGERGRFLLGSGGWAYEERPWGGIPGWSGPVWLEEEL